MLFLRCPKCGQAVPYETGTGPSTLYCPKCGTHLGDVEPEEGEVLPGGKPIPKEGIPEEGGPKISGRESINLPPPTQEGLIRALNGFAWFIIVVGVLASVVSFVQWVDTEVVFFLYATVIGILGSILGGLILLVFAHMASTLNFISTLLEKDLKKK